MNTALLSGSECSDFGADNFYGCDVAARGREANDGAACREHSAHQLSCNPQVKTLLASLLNRLVMWVRGWL